MQHKIEILLTDQSTAYQYLNQCIDEAVKTGYSQDEMMKALYKIFSEVSKYNKKKYQKV